MSAASAPSYLRRWRLAVALLFILQAASGCSPQADKGRYMAADRAAHAVKDSLSKEVGYDQFGALLDRFSREVEVLKAGNKSRKDEELADAYSALLGIYRDGYLLWKYQREFKRYDIVPEGLIYVGQDVEPIVAKYRFTVTRHVYGPTHTAWKSIPEDSIRIIWFNADAQLKLIDSLLNE